MKEDLMRSSKQVQYNSGRTYGTRRYLQFIADEVANDISMGGNLFNSLGQHEHPVLRNKSGVALDPDVVIGDLFLEADDELYMGTAVDQDDEQDLPVNEGCKPVP